MRPIKKILVPTDFSACADAALDEAIAMARTNGATVTLLHVYQLPLPMGGLRPILTEDTFRVIEDSAQAALTNTLGRARTRAGSETWPEMRVKLCMGSPYENVVDEIRAGAYDLVVMGTHGRTGIKHLLVGSVAERVVRLSPCPVLTVRAAGQGASATP